ncbi:glucose dehydrogenase [FAD, quinone] isoform X1 [Microplitis demolitor]|uniref:glucose dehydrogenase [FAD, quinone] isoform X1 n=1 Tax=Microplitis demolitor TaxID=69319 RepID=UPI0004CCBB6F|nr:glucose dehydrogenase [FAD, quinone] isoform X1 [Microplitis demolitor]
MDLIIKWSAYWIYSIGVFLFINYLNIYFLLSSVIDYLTNNLQDGQTYDYVIVGAGSAGITLAAKLIDAGHKIIIIEAGGTAPTFADIPVLAPLFQLSNYDWQYKTVPQNHSCKALINNQSLWPMGKILGGSSRLNYMAYVEGHQDDYWWFDDYHNHKLSNESTESPRWCSELCEAILQSVEEINQSKKIDESFDFNKVKLTITDGERWSTDRLLKPRYGNNLKIKFKSNKAESVELTKWGKRFVVYGSKGVIISAGAIGTPKLLMLSGIGPRNQLEKLNIKVISDLPVGKNLVDHILTGIDLVIVDKSLSISVPQLLKPTSAFNYLLFRQGPWTSAGIEVVGTVARNSSPDLQFMVIPVGVSQDNGVVLRKAMGIKDQVFDEYFAPLAYKTAVTIAPVLLHPKSTGEVKLKSSDPLDDVIINPNYLASKDDVSILIKGLRLIEKLISTKAMKALGASLYKKPFPGCENINFGTDDYWECYIRQLTLTSYHPAGTCKLGSVVNNSFRVLGTKNLYVVDASVLPSLPSGNINAAVMMIASKAADLIIKSANKLNNFHTKNNIKSCTNNYSNIFNNLNDDVCLKSA